MKMLLQHFNCDQSYHICDRTPVDPEKLQLILAGAPGKLAPLARMVRLGESLN
jgi:hypothetical protein